MDAHKTIKCWLITNPQSGRGGVDLSAPLTILRENGWDVSVLQKLHGGHATELAQEAVRAGCQVVVDCGGDGTLNEVVEGVLGTETAVGVLPGGTANLWAREVGVASRLQVAAAQLVSAERRRVDVGQVAINGRHKSHFVLMAGVGFDGAVIERVNKPLKNRIGTAAVGLAALRALPAAQAVPVRMELDDLRWQGRVSQIIVGNTRRYGGLGHITADAFADDGLFDVCLITATGVFTVSRVLGSLLLHKHLSPALAQFYRAATVTITAPVTMPLQADGGSIHLEDEEPTAEGTQYVFSLLARGVTMLVPRMYNDELFRPTRLASQSTDAELDPVPTQEDAHHGEKDHHHAKSSNKEKQWRMTVLEVGVESLTAARVKSGKVVHVRIGPDTALDDGTGRQKQLLSALSSVTAGDLVRVTGLTNGDKHALVATRVALIGTNGHHPTTEVE